MQPKHSMAVVCICFIALSLASGCATIGPAPAKLSAEVGDRMAEMQGLHLHAIESFFASERKRIEDFLEKRWIPLYLQNYLATSRLMDEISRSTFVGATDKVTLTHALKDYLDDSTEAEAAANEIIEAISAVRRQESPKVRETLDKYIDAEYLELAISHINLLLGATDPGLMILEWAQDAQEQINLQRKEMLQPLEHAQRTITSEVTVAYADILKANGVITARLEAAAKLKESQDSMLKALGVKDRATSLRSKLESISRKVGSAITAADEVLGDAGKYKSVSGEKVYEALTTLKNSLSGLENVEEGSE